MSDSFNTTTITFAAGDQTLLRSITVDETAAEINVTGAASSEYIYEAGIPNPTVSWEQVGTSTLSTGDKGAIVIAWGDGTAVGGITNAVITKVSPTGSLDGEITTSITARPSTAP